MKLYKNILSIIAGFTLIFGVMSCEELEVGNDFLSKPPTIDYTKDSVFKSARKAKELLWNMYSTLPYGRYQFFNNKNRGYGVLAYGWLQSLTDISSDSKSGTIKGTYYSGNYNAATSWEGARFPQYRTYAWWDAYFMGWTFIDNLHKVPDMEQEEKDRLKAEARMIMATHYTLMFKWLGGVVWINKAYEPDDDLNVRRLTVMETVDSVTALIDKAIPDLPTQLANIAADKGRFTKAGAYALKTRFLTHAASPLLNSDQPYMDGEASDKELTWTGGYKPELWERARDAAKNCIDIIEASGYYGMEQPESEDSAAYRLAYRDGYLDRGSGESLISTRQHFNDEGWWDQGIARGSTFPWFPGPSPTHNYAQMFPDKNGVPISESSLYDPEHPYRNKDPRFYETMFSSISMWNQYRKIELWEGGKEGPNKTVSRAGYLQFKFVLSGKKIADMPQHWPFIRVPEVYLCYAEALTEINNGPTAEAYEYVNKVRHRVGLQDIQDVMDNPGNKQAFIDAILRERVLEFGFEKVRWFDITRRKRKDILQKDLFGVRVIKESDGSLSYNEFLFWDKYPTAKRDWIDNWSPKWYIFPFPNDEINKEYGLVQNPGWKLTGN